MRLVLSRVEPRDIDAFLPILHEAFQGQTVCFAFFGHPDPLGFAYTKKFFLNALKNDPHDIFLKIEDLDAQMEVTLLDEEGHSIGTETRTRIVSVSDWKLYPTYVAPEQLEVAETNGESETKKVSLAERFPFLTDPQEQEDAAVHIDDFMTKRRKWCTEAHLLCFLLFTDPEYQYKGAGRMMMQWGNDVADAMMLPCWIEGSRYGEHLYELMGYEGKERVYLKTKSFISEHYHMRRPPKVNKMIGRALTRQE